MDRYYEAFGLKSEKDKISESQGSNINLMSERTNATKAVRKIPNKSKKGTTKTTKAVRKIPNKSKKGTTNATKEVRKIPNKSKKEDNTDEENLYDFNDYLNALYEEAGDVDKELGDLDYFSDEDQQFSEEDDETTNDKEDHLTLPSCGKYNFKF